MSELVLPEPLKTLMNKIERKTITNFYGAPGTGKTNICILASVETIKTGKNVLYIDTESSFSAERFKQITGERAEYLNKVKLIEPKTFLDLHKMIKELDKLLNKDIGLIVVDSTSNLYRLEYADAKEEDDKVATIISNRRLSKQLSILHNIAKERDIPVIVTSHMTKNWDTEENDVVGGEMVKYWSKAIILLEKTGKANERKAIIIKHRSLPEGKDVKFLLVENGIKPSKFKLI